MFHRLLIEDWQQFLNIVLFFAFAIVLLLTFVRAWRLPRKSVQHLAELPLSSDESHD